MIARGRAPARTQMKLQATLMALDGRRSSRFLGIMLGYTGTELHTRRGVFCSAGVSRRRPPWQPRKIVVGFDGSTYARCALRTAEELTHTFSGTVEVVAATDGQEIGGDAAYGPTWSSCSRTTPTSRTHEWSTSASAPSQRSTACCTRCSSDQRRRVAGSFARQPRVSSVRDRRRP